MSVQNRNAWTKTEIPVQKQKFLDKKQKYLDKNRNAWTKTEILGEKQKYLNKNADTWTKKYFDKR